MLANHPEERTGGSSCAVRDGERLVVQRCVVEAARRAARSIPHLDFDCLCAILAAHVQVTLDRFRGEAPLEHWVKRVLRNKVVDLVKFEQASAQRECASLETGELEPADPRRSPQREASLSELRALLEEEYGGTREGRILLLLLTGEASTVTQAARDLGWNHPTALAHIRRHPVVLGLLREAL